MALADIVSRIDRDGVAEAADIVAEAQERADALVTSARTAAEAARAARLARAEHDAHAEAETLLATARLEARDRALAARRQLVEDVLTAARDAVLALPDDQYAELLARRIVASARGGESVLISGADAARVAGKLPEAVARAGGDEWALVWSEEPAPVEHGVVLKGDRVSVDLSVDALIGERRDELSMRAAQILFGGAGG